MTVHAEEEMSDDGLSIFDVESAMLTGKIIERQKDKNTEEWKYLIKGKTLSDQAIVIVGSDIGYASLKVGSILQKGFLKGVITSQLGILVNSGQWVVFNIVRSLSANEIHNIWCNRWHKQAARRANTCLYLRDRRIFI